MQTYIILSLCTLTVILDFYIIKNYYVPLNALQSWVTIVIHIHRRKVQ